MTILRRIPFSRFAVFVVAACSPLALSQSQATVSDPPPSFEPQSAEALHRLDYFVSIDYVGHFLAGGACDCAGRLLVEFDTLAYDADSREFFIAGSVSDLATDEPLEYPDVFLAPFELPDSGFVFYSPSIEGASDSVGAFVVCGAAEENDCLYFGVPTYKLTIFALHKLFGDREGAP
jgi:hypothetical protein